MKFLCVDCDAQMESVDKGAPGDGTLAIMFRCPECERSDAGRHEGPSGESK